MSLTKNADGARRPRAFMIALTTAVVTGLTYVVTELLGGTLGDLLARNDPAQTLTGGRSGPFSWPLGGPDSTPDTRTAWLAGLGAALLVIVVLVAISARKGAWAGFVGGWLATVVGTVTGAVTGSLVLVNLDGSTFDEAVQVVYGRAVPHAAIWGIAVGLVVGLVVAALTGMLRTKSSKTEDTTRPSGRPADASGHRFFDDVPEQRDSDATTTSTTGSATSSAASAPTDRRPAGHDSMDDTAVRARPVTSGTTKSGDS